MDVRQLDWRLRGLGLLLQDAVFSLLKVVNLSDEFQQSLGVLLDNSLFAQFEQAFLVFAYHERLLIGAGAVLLVGSAALTNCLP